MDVKKLGGCLHKLGVKYDRPLFELATKAFDEDPVSYTHLTLPTICSV